MSQSASTLSFKSQLYTPPISYLFSTRHTSTQKATCWAMHSKAWMIFSLKSFNCFNAFIGKTAVTWINLCQAYTFLHNSSYICHAVSLWGHLDWLCLCFVPENWDQHSIEILICHRLCGMERHDQYYYLYSHYQNINSLSCLHNSQPLISAWGRSYVSPL